MSPRGGPRARNAGSSPDHRCRTRRVVEALERRAANELAHAARVIRERMDGCHLHGGLVVEIRQNARQPFCEHRLARAGRPEHEEVVTAGRRHLEGTLSLVLARYVTEIEAGARCLGIVGVFTSRPRGGRRDLWKDDLERIGAQIQCEATEILVAADTRARHQPRL